MAFSDVVKGLFMMMAGDDGRLDADDEILPLLSLWILLCFSWHSFIELSRSVSRWRSQSTVRLSTVNWFGWSFPTVSSISWSSKRNITGSAGEDRCLSVKSLYSSGEFTDWRAESILLWISMYLSDVMSPKFEASTSKFFLKEFHKTQLKPIIYSISSRDAETKSIEGQRHNFLMSSANVVGIILLKHEIFVWT